MIIIAVINLKNQANFNFNNQANTHFLSDKLKLFESLRTAGEFMRFFLILVTGALYVMMRHNRSTLFASQKFTILSTKLKSRLGRPSRRKSHKTADFFCMGGAQPHSIAFGGVFPNITEAILVNEISTKVRKK